MRGNKLLTIVPDALFEASGTTTNNPSGSPVPLPWREAAARLRDGDRLFGGLANQ